MRSTASSVTSPAIHSTHETKYPQLSPAQFSSTHYGLDTARRPYRVPYQPAPEEVNMRRTYAPSYLPGGVIPRTADTPRDKKFVPIYDQPGPTQNTQLAPLTCYSFISRMTGRRFYVQYYGELGPYRRAKYSIRKTHNLCGGCKQTCIKLIVYAYLLSSSGKHRKS